MVRESLVLLHTSIDEVRLVKNPSAVASMEAGEQVRGRGLKRPNRSISNPPLVDHGDVDVGNLPLQAQSSRSTSTASVSDDAQSAAAARETSNNRPSNLDPSPSATAPTDEHRGAHQQDEEDEHSVHTPLHESQSEHETLEIEAAMRFHHNRRVLLSRLEETVPHGRLCMVCVFDGV